MTEQTANSTLKATTGFGMKGDHGRALAKEVLATIPGLKVPAIPFADNVHAVFYDKNGAMAFEDAALGQQQIYMQCANGRKPTKEQIAQAATNLNADNQEPMIEGYPFKAVFTQGSPIGPVCAQAPAARPKRVR